MKPGIMASAGSAYGSLSKLKMGADGNPSALFFFLGTAFRIQEGKGIKALPLAASFCFH